MKTILASLLLAFSSMSFAAEKMVFSCTPIETNKGVEGVEITATATETVMKILTKSQRPGRLNEELNPVQFSKDEFFHSYVSAEMGSSLKIMIMNGKPRKDGWYVGQLLNKKYDVLLNCQYKL